MIEIISIEFSVALFFHLLRNSEILKCSVTLLGSDLTNAVTKIKKDYSILQCFIC